MTGTGTQADPYIVDNWEDFITAAGTSGAYVEFPKNLVLTSDTEIVEGKLYVDSTGEPITNPVVSGLSSYYENTFVLDQNDYAPEGLTSDISMSCKDFNGAGGVIKNIYFKSGQFKHTVSGGNANGILRNVNFSNILIREGSAVLSFNSTLFKCIFSTSVDQDVAKSILQTYSSSQGIMKNCSIYIGSVICSQSINACSGLGTPDSQYNRIFVSAPMATLSAPKMTNFQIRGECYALNIASGSSYGVIDCNVDTQASGSNATQCLINSNKVNGTISGLTAVTSAQLADASYLASIGFPIQT